MPRLDAVIGLGNPGSRYRRTYHNLGFQAIDTLVNSFPTESVSADGGTLLKTTNQPEFFLGKPGRYVNRSGDVIKDWAEAFGWCPDRLLVILDDFSLDVGRLRLRPSGRAGGHNGLRSILTSFDTRDIPRLRIGIGPLPTGMDPTTLVLAEITSEDQKIYSKLMHDLTGMFLSLPEQSWQEAMSALNGRDYSDDSEDC